MLRSDHSAAAPALSGPGEVTRLLSAARAGDRVAVDRLFASVYEELHGLARRQLGGRATGATLSTTVLVHEAYLKLVGGSPIEYGDRRHFFALAARAMRQVIIDHARRAQARKRGGHMVRLDVDSDRVENGRSTSADIADLIALNDALISLEALSERLARIVELRYFAGLSVEETGDVMDLSPRTVKRDWRKARAILFAALEGRPVESSP